MVFAQKLILDPLEEIEAMKALLRWKEEYLKDEVSNVEIEQYLSCLQSKSAD